MARQRVNFYSGVISSLASSTAGATTTITGNGLGVGFPVPSAGNYIPITLNPGYFGANNTSGPEIAYITPGGSSTIANVTRVVEGSVFASGTNVPWVAGPVLSDFDASNLSSSGVVTFNNGLVVYGGDSIYGGDVVQQGNLTVSGNATVSGNISTSGTITASGATFTTSPNVTGKWMSNTAINPTGVTTGYSNQVAVSVSGYTNYLINYTIRVTSSASNTQIIQAAIQKAGSTISVNAQQTTSAGATSTLTISHLDTGVSTGVITYDGVVLIGGSGSTATVGGIEMNVIGLN